MTDDEASHRAILKMLDAGFSMNDILSGLETKMDRAKAIGGLHGALMQRELQGAKAEEAKAAAAENEKAAA
jgi:hypothetical protein